MKLKKIYFDAFKSLLKKELEIVDNCLGLVGINESGKSNLLYAINVLKGDRNLSSADTPKMENKKHNPSLRFDFELTYDERKLLLEEILIWSESNTLVGKRIKKSNFNITYHIVYDRKEENEKRFFSLTDFEIDKNYFILSNKYSNDLYKIFHRDSFVSLNKALIIKDSDIKADEKRLQIIDKIKTIDEQIEMNEALIKEKKQEAELKSKTENADVPVKKENSKGDGKEEPTQISKIQDKIDDLILKRNELATIVEKFNLSKLINSLSESIEKKKTNTTRIREELSTVNATLTELKKIAEPNDAQKKEIIGNTKKTISLKLKLQQNTASIKNEENQVVDLQTPLAEKYTKEISELTGYLIEVIHDSLDSLLPTVVFWKHDKVFILDSETLFSDLLSATELPSVSRPLVNLFRLGLEIETINDLHNRIKEIQSDSNERSKLNRQLNRKVNKYIKSVWPEYDQNILITLENDRIRIEITDSGEYDDSSFYNMEERSQGAQTFLSFLFTIGAEAEKGVIKDTILLLDEPETHLHPSGVRSLLKELIKISDSGNLVIYATHSTFMIDKKNYGRHIILEKHKEQTTIKPSSKNRIGFFMQEEVLYSTLDVDLEKEISSNKSYNFVFEGDGDAIIFEHFYSKILKSQPFALENTSFYHGGGCTNIRKYLKHRPIQLGTTWIFILDSDTPANQLKGFIEKKYKDYMNKDIYVFQYKKEKKKSDEIELEDILPSSIILDSYNKTAIKHDFEFDKKELIKLLKEDKSFVESNKAIMSNLYKGNDIELFKGEFKEILNNEISNKLSVSKDETSFKKEFPEFLKWSSGLISEIEDSKKQEKEKIT